MILLDTCSLLWLVADQEKFSSVAYEAIEKHNGAIFVSAISALEIAIKTEKNLLQLPCAPTEWFAKILKLHSLMELTLDYTIAMASALLPRHHDDPFNRIIVATAAKHNLKILTPDKHIHAYTEVKCIW